MAKRPKKSDNRGNRNDRRPNGKAWKGGKAPIDRRPGDKGYSGPDVKSGVVPTYG